MDMNISWSQRKLRRRNGKNRSSDRGVFRISDLPDCLLEQILSNLEIKEAIKTSLISRRWRHLWTRVPSLKFVFNKSDYIPDWSDYMPLNHRQEVLRNDYIYSIIRQITELYIPGFVNKVFDRRGACEIDKFEYRCDLVSDPRFLNYMMSRAMSLNVKEVELHVPCYNQECIWQLPECLCAKKSSLKKLKLCTPIFNPPKINSSFLTLKELRLYSLSGPQGQGRKAPWQELCTSQCPVLETLSFTKCFCSFIDLEISSPMLKHLEILDTYFNRVVVSAPLLAYFKFKGFGVEEIAIDDRGNFLEEVEIDVKVDGSDLKEKLTLFLRRLEKAKSCAITWK